MPQAFDILVIGGGPAGYSAAIHAARAATDPPIRVGVVEARQFGGTCLNRGCIPTKALLDTARLLDQFAEAPSRGIDVTGSATINLSKAMQSKDRIVRRMSTGVDVLLRENGVERIKGVASVRRNENDGFPFLVSLSGGGEEMSARKIILATGSVPSTVPVPGLDAPEIAQRIWTSDDLLDAASPPDRIPTKLAILGGGVIGIEMARIFRAFGSDVHLVEAMPRLVPMLDVEISETLKKSLETKRIAVTLGRSLQRVGPAPDGLVLRLDDGTETVASHLLVAVGRSPKIDMLSEELLAELKPDRRGFLPVDEEMRTGVEGLFAPGDVNGRCMLAHAAIEMGRLAAWAAVEELGSKAEESVIESYRRRIMEKSDHSQLPDPTRNFFPFYVPSCIYGEPETGSFGWTEEEARKYLGENIRIGRFPFAANGRAAASGHRDGFVKLIRLRDEPRVVGVHIVGPCASELINEVSAVIASGGDVQRWAQSVHAHPTFGEALLEAAADAFDFALHLPPRNPPGSKNDNPKT